jgi:hypothetical protein
MRISATIWWFFPSCLPDENLLTLQDLAISYPPTRERPNPRPNGSDLLGRCFFDPELGVCCITRLGPVTQKQMPSRANRQLATTDKPVATGTHYTLHYKCVLTGDEHYSSVDEVVQWINNGPILQPPTCPSDQNTHVSAPSYGPPLLHTSIPAGLPPTHKPVAGATPRSDQPIKEPPNTGATTSVPLHHDITRQSTRKRVPRDLLQPTMKGKTYHTFESRQLRGKQRVPITMEYPEKQRVTAKALKLFRQKFLLDEQVPFPTTMTHSLYRAMYNRYRLQLKKQHSDRIDWLDIFGNMSPEQVHRGFVRMERKFRSKARISANNIFDRAMPKPSLPPVFPRRPLNLNEDGTTINYKKSHSGPHALYWAQADAEEIERLFTSGTLRPIYCSDIPPHKRATYVNPVCSEKLRDEGDIKFRTRATIGGDQVDYPYNTTAVTANLESIKILLNAMISDNINLATIDPEDFYLGTPLPHPEYIRIPSRLIPPKVIAFYKLQQYLHKGALYCAVLKTHYGLPQAGALSQERLFNHLEQHGYRQLPHSPSLFRNRDGSIRFALVVDDFAVAWKGKENIKHFIQTLRKMYTVKIDWKGSKYLGMDISIDRIHRHVTVSMPGYKAKLLRRVRPQGVKTARTPSIYHPPNYKSPKSQTATIDASPFATKTEQKELQVVVGTLLYYARTVDPSILTAVHELGSVQAQPTTQDMQKVERLLQYVSTHQNSATRYYASTMQLQVQTDASYLCRPKARSVLGGYHYLGFPDRINGPVFCTSKIISCVVASVAEAELGAGF